MTSKRRKPVRKPAVRKARPVELAVLFDTETTGLVENMSLPLDRQPEVIEFYACLADLSNGKIERELDLLIRPKKLPLPPKITQITGITDDMVADKKWISHHAPEIFEILEAGAVAIAHNASFDRDMMTIEASRLGLSVRWPPLVCTVEATVHLKGFRLSLSAMHEHLFAAPFAGAHRAREDVQALLRCCVELRRQDQI